MPGANHCSGGCLRHCEQAFTGGQESFWPGWGNLVGRRQLYGMGAGRGFRIGRMSTTIAKPLRFRLVTDEYPTHLIMLTGATNNAPWRGRPAYCWQLLGTSGVRQHDKWECEVAVVEGDFSPPMLLQEDGTFGPLPGFRIEVDFNELGFGDLIADETQP